MPPTKKKNDRIFIGQVCAFCGNDGEDEFTVGQFYSSDFICAHSNCLFLASGLCQNASSPRSGIFGFLLKDIEAELRRGKKLCCSFCKKRGATIGCCRVTCRKSFHLNCGIENGTLHQFFDDYKSFCKDHRPKQEPLEIRNIHCAMCFEDIAHHEIELCLYPPCCKKNMFHKVCLQRQAFNAGRHFFRCPFCNDEDIFIPEMKRFGIYLPDRDASWELEENAFHELLPPRLECTAEICLYPSRLYMEEHHPKGEWKFITCSICGSNSTHRLCGKLAINKNSWLCDECVVVNKKVEIEMQKKKKKQGSPIASTSRENYSISKCDMIFHGLPSCGECLQPTIILEDCFASNSALVCNKYNISIPYPHKSVESEPRLLGETCEKCNESKKTIEMGNIEPVDHMSVIKPKETIEIDDKSITKPEETIEMDGIGHIGDMSVTKPEETIEMDGIGHIDDMPVTKPEETIKMDGIGHIDSMSVIKSEESIEMGAVKHTDDMTLIKPKETIITSIMSVIKPTENYVTEPDLVIEPKENIETDNIELNDDMSVIKHDENIKQNLLVQINKKSKSVKQRDKIEASGMSDTSKNANTVDIKPNLMVSINSKYVNCGMKQRGKIEASGVSDTFKRANIVDIKPNLMVSINRKYVNCGMKYKDKTSVIEPVVCKKDISHSEFNYVSGNNANVLKYDVGETSQSISAGSMAGNNSIQGRFQACSCFVARGFNLSAPATNLGTTDNMRNVANNSVKKRPQDEAKMNIPKKIVKKRKPDGCGNSNGNNKCIGKYFGQSCSKRMII